MQEVKWQWHDYEEPKPILQCDCQGCDIYEGDDYYDVNGDIVCENCLKLYMRRFRKVAG